jgi:hypothetical protein
MGMSLKFLSIGGRRNKCSSEFMQFGEFLIWILWIAPPIFPQNIQPMPVKRIALISSNSGYLMGI